MTFCTLDQAIRWYGADTAVAREKLGPLVTVTDEWIRDTYKMDWGDSGTFTDTFFNVEQGGLIYLKSPDPQNVSVAVFPEVSFDYPFWTLSEGSQFEVQDGGCIQLVYSPYVIVPGMELALARVPSRMWAKVEVTYTSNVDIPAQVQEACALIAAATLAQTPALLTGMAHESTPGGYSYTRFASVELIIPDLARKWLRGKSRRFHARVV